MLEFLNSQTIRRVMVEGGAEVISSFLASHLADRLVLTIAPLMLGGLGAIDFMGKTNGQGMPHLANPVIQPFGKDVVLFGDLVWE
ncbi:MAG: dihydrofolate reductase family protein [Chloroflexota bacterium]